MTDQEIIAANEATDQDNDWTKEQRRIELAAEQMLQRPPRHKFTFIGEQSRRHEAVSEIQWDNIRAVEVETHRYDEQNN